jgi:hypothetical protein
MPKQPQGVLRQMTVLPSVDPSRAVLIEEALVRFGEVRLRVTGSSMLPAIWPGDMLTVRRAGIEQVRLRDVALFTREGRLFAHRVVARGGRYVVAQGDTVPSPDAPVTASELLGVVVDVSRNGKTSRSFANPGRPARLVSAIARRSSRFSKVLQRVQMRSLYALATMNIW